MTSNVTRRLKAGLIALALVLSQVVLPVQSAYATSTQSSEKEKVKEKEEDKKLNDKVFVCKYVKTPGATETASHIISVAVNTQNNYEPGDFFADGQELSYVLEYDNKQPAPSTAACPKYVALPAQPTANDPCNPTDDEDFSNIAWGTRTDTPAYFWTVNLDGSLTVTANEGYQFKTDLETFESHTFTLPEDSGVMCEGEIVNVLETPEAPEIIDECNDDDEDNAYWNKPEDGDNVIWTINSEGKLIATATGDYVFENGQKSFNYGLAVDNGEECPDEQPNVCTVSNNLHIQPWTDGTYQYPYVGGAGLYSFEADGLHLSTPAISSYVFGEMSAGQTPVRHIDDMSYQTLRDTTSVGSSQIVTAYILSIDLDGDLSDATDQTYLFYEPTYNGTVVSGIWQTWNVDAGDAKFWSFELTGGNPTLTWSQIVADYPDAIALTYGFNQGTYNQGTDARIQNLVFDCAKTVFGTPGRGETPVTPVVPVVPTIPTIPTTPSTPIVPVVATAAAGQVLPEELPMTGQNGSVLFTWIALLGAILTYGSVYYLQPKKRFEQ